MSFPWRRMWTRSTVLSFALGVLLWNGLGSADADESATLRQKIPQRTPAGVEVGSQSLDLDLVRAAVEKCSTHFPQDPLEECLDSFWAPRWQLEAAARARGFSQGAHFLLQRDHLLHQALVERTRRELAPATDEQVARYLEEHRRDVQKPLRLRLFRILSRDRDEAEKLIEQLPEPLDITTFRALAREHSIDRATHERGGDLGFVWPDGSTDIPQIHVSPDLYQAALSLDDGQWSSEPVAEGDHYAVLWRRGSLDPVGAEDGAEELARLRIRESRAAEAVETLLSELRKRFVQDRNDVLLGKLRRSDTAMFHEPDL